MTSKYIEEHYDELVRIKEQYEKMIDKAMQYRAECIDELIRWENVKLE